jgi:3-isopropylmalate/(R)-2-methylmalate dehydratase small subunit
MALAKITNILGKGVYVFGADIDTDRIIPARFMKCVTFEGLGQYTFYDVRFDEQDNSKNHTLDKPEHKGASILISGDNFGCGSSREHAPQALYHWGIRGIIAESYAEIFFGNCTTLGIPCVTVSKEDSVSIGKITEAKPEAQIEIDLENKVVKADGQTFQCNIPDNARNSLINGKWDSLGDLLEGTEEVKQTTKKLPYMNFAAV